MMILNGTILLYERLCPKTVFVLISNSPVTRSTLYFDCFNTTHYQLQHGQFKIRTEIVTFPLGLFIDIISLIGYEFNISLNHILVMQNVISPPPVNVKSYTFVLVF